MSTQKTQPTDVDPLEFLSSLPHAGRREDCLKLLKLASAASGEEGIMWGPSMIGFGQYDYIYRSGHRGTALAIGFAPRASKIALYGIAQAPGSEELLEQLGPHTRGAGCVYITRLHSVNADILEEAFRLGYEFTTGPQINAAHPDFKDFSN